MKKDDLINTINKNIKIIIDQANIIIDHLETFLDICDKVIKEVTEIKIIKYKNFYTPIENALLSDDITQLLSKFSPPEIILEEVKKMFFYIPSLFPHFLYNYSDFTFAYSKENTLKFYPSEKEINDNRFHSSSRALSLHNNQILITGPNKTTLLLNIENETIFELFQLNEGRN